MSRRGQGLPHTTVRRVSVRAVDLATQLSVYFHIVDLSHDARSVMIT